MSKYRLGVPKSSIIETGPCRSFVVSAYFPAIFLEFHCLFLSLFWEDIHYFNYSWVLIKSCCVIFAAAGFLWNRLCVLPICGHPISFCANHWESFCLNKHFGFGLIIIGTKRTKKNSDLDISFRFWKKSLFIHKIGMSSLHLATFL